MGTILNFKIDTLLLTCEEFAEYSNSHRNLAKFIKCLDNMIGELEESGADTRMNLEEIKQRIRTLKDKTNYVEPRRFDQQDVMRDFKKILAILQKARARKETQALQVSKAEPTWKCWLCFMAGFVFCIFVVIMVIKNYGVMGEKMRK